MSAQALGTAIEQRLKQECEAISAALSSTHDLHAAIHATRKAVRRMRALLALLADTALALERTDRALQRLGDGLSTARDAHVVVEAARQLQQRHPAPGWDRVIALLGARRARILQRLQHADPGLQRRRRAIERICEGLAPLAWDAVRRQHLRHGLARSERRVDKAAARAMRHHEPEAIHRWRRRVRRLRMQRDVMRELGALPGEKAGQAGDARQSRNLHKLSDQLGWQQDLRLLHALVRAMPAHADKPALLGQIQQAMQS